MAQRPEQEYQRIPAFGWPMEAVLSRFSRFGRNCRAALFLLCAALVAGAPDASADNGSWQQSSVARLQSVLDSYRDLEARGGWPTIPEHATFRLGDDGPAVARLKERLSLSTDLAELNGESGGFDETLAGAVERFQARHGLVVDGVVGQQTRAALNVSVGDRIRQISASLRRLRSLPDTTGDRMILVNVAGFELDVVDDGEVLFNSPVVVGRRSRPTPTLTSTVTRIIVNPYWRVPRRIAVNDILPQIRRDPSYLERHKFKVFATSGGAPVEVAADKVNWHSLNANNFSYLLVQDPGPLNALGRVKFFFPNEHDIFMHDTPARDLFKHKSRAFSSGCIRVSKAVELVDYLLKQEGDRAYQAMAEALNSGETRQITLAVPIPLHIVYLTAWADEAGQAHFRDDIYGLDAVADTDIMARGPELRDVARAYDTARTGCAGPARPAGDLR